METPKQLLIVEDEITTWLALKMQAEAAEPELVIARFGRRVDEFKPWFATKSQMSVAIVDLQLPSDTGINPDGGFEVVETMKLKQPDLKIIILTSRNDHQAYERAGSLPGIRHYFTKPWNKEELRDAIRECLAPDGAPKEIVLHGALE
jgi:DNA-binding NarL/FixJ family response regulator